MHVFYERETVEDSPNVGYQGPCRTVAVAGGMVLWSAMFGTMYAGNGLLGEVLAGELGAITSLGIVAAIYLPYAVWSTHDLTHYDPNQ